MERSIAAIAVAPVKAFALEPRERVALGRDGVEENRRFLLVDEHGARLRSSRHAWQCTLSARYDAGAGRLEVRLRDGTDVHGPVETGPPLMVEYHGRSVRGHVVEGPWTEPLTRIAGQHVRLVRTEQAGGVQGAPVTIVSTATLERIAGEAGREIDPRRFRMLLHVDGCASHEEDDWAGRRVRIGPDAVVRIVETVERCVVTTRDPETGVHDIDTLALLKRYRGCVDLGVRASVEHAGDVAIGDEVELLE